MAVRPERAERVFRAVARGREAVRAQPDPRQEGRERDLVEDLGIEGIAALADEYSPYAFCEVAEGHEPRSIGQGLSRYTPNG
jgi:hypothetical protein